PVVQRIAGTPDVSLVLDAGALLAIDRRDRRMGALLRVAQQERIAVRTSPAAVAQVLHHGARQAHLARVLAGVAAPPLDLRIGGLLGALLATSRTRDVVDAHVASLARAGDLVLTSDPEDLRHLLEALSIDAAVVRV
ncbi:MAG: hypothetical protein ACRDSO_17160, partial [Pseudonocardiaceae bacterium]